MYKVGALISDLKLAACKCCGQTWLGVSPKDDQPFKASDALGCPDELEH